MSIAWVDSALDSGWTELSAVRDRKAIECLSAGFLIHETPDHITIAAAVHDESAAGVVRIPRPSIRWLKIEIPAERNVPTSE